MIVRQNYKVGRLVYRLGHSVIQRKKGSSNLPPAAGLVESCKVYKVEMLLSLLVTQYLNKQIINNKLTRRLYEKAEIKS